MMTKVVAIAVLILGVSMFAGQRRGGGRGGGPGGGGCLVGNQNYGDE